MSKVKFPTLVVATLAIIAMSTVCIMYAVGRPVPGDLLSITALLVGVFVHTEPDLGAGSTVGAGSTAGAGSTVGAGLPEFDEGYSSDISDKLGSGRPVARRVE